MSRKWFARRQVCRLNALSLLGGFRPEKHHLIRKIDHHLGHALEQKVLFPIRLQVQLVVGVVEDDIEMPQ